ncbi:methylated-DNA--[protein]-cysteine S-methyltransferase [Rugosimonospora africana]|uniref:Methylated-DNA--protein-cysteine methyltransferase n=1 Tax=Rugosimonospora africana TaxID=556532 RepID=A0A8J3QQ71_9ACTN|nr:methylated-DNA--[protein]-cysteine S-methyltransferase [Rugosimonospora africana]GIH14928.1 methylated-DNA--protein-cysteine methyltransferase [Rugosimonospora africana]
MNTRHTVTDTDLGPITIVATGDAITGLYFDRHARRPRQEAFGPRVPMISDSLLGQACQQLLEYLAGQRTTFDLPLDAAGNDLQRSVWKIVSDIPYGQTITYGEIAERLGDRALAQKVGQAVGANPLCVVVPCHRVLGATGALTGYAGGLTRKRALLELEEPAAVSTGRLF